MVLDLRYEARDIDQNITSQDKIDLWFEAKTRGLNDFARAQLKKKWGTMQKVLSSQSRLEKIVSDILLDMETRGRFVDGRGNAILVSGSIIRHANFTNSSIRLIFLVNVQLSPRTNLPLKKLRMRKAVKATPRNCTSTIFTAECWPTSLMNLQIEQSIASKNLKKKSKRSLSKTPV